MAGATRNEFDEDDDDVEDRDDPDPSDQDDGEDDDVDTLPCPYCGKPIAEQAELCPHCRSFISFEDAPRRKPAWIWLAVALALIAAVMLAC
jgi:predicted nucleic acid-binding Zn ribbon protein